MSRVKLVPVIEEPDRRFDYRLEADGAYRLPNGQPAVTFLEATVQKKRRHAVRIPGEPNPWEETTINFSAFGNQPVAVVETFVDILRQAVDLAKTLDAQHKDS